MFLKLNEHVVFDENFLKQYSLDAFMRVPMTYEHPKLELPENLKEALENVLKNMQKGPPPQCKDLVKEFVDLVEVYENFMATST